uniref:Uncharacterized protein n=1 Tax=Rhizophora mucronata TaxID=61149 RepID=A0A2P2IQ42_RHIMU
MFSSGYSTANLNSLKAVWFQTCMFCPVFPNSSLFYTRMVTRCVYSLSN